MQAWKQNLKEVLTGQRLKKSICWMGLIEAKLTLLNVREWMQRLTKENQIYAWKTIYEGYITKYGNFRLISQIKDQWALKSAKKDISRFNRAQRRPGGGPAPSTPKELSMLIQINNFLFYSILQSLFPNEFDSLTNPFDDDFPVPIEK